MAIFSIEITAKLQKFVLTAEKYLEVMGELSIGTVFEPLIRFKSLSRVGTQLLLMHPNPFSRFALCFSVGNFAWCIGDLSPTLLAFHV